MIRTELIAPIPALLRRHAEARGDKIAYRDVRGAVTYGALLATTANLAGHLQELGVSPGAGVAIFLPNSVEWIQSCVAIGRADAACVPISYDATLPEIAYRLADAACRVVITTDERAEMIEQALAEIPGEKTIILVERGPRFPAHRRFAELIGSAPRARPRDSASIDAPSFIIYTSGTKIGRASCRERV